MGADLYINSITDAAREKYQFAFDAAVTARNGLQEEYAKSNPNSSERIRSVRMATEYQMPDTFEVPVLNEEEIRVSEALASLQVKVDEIYDFMFPDDGYFRDSYNNSSLFWILGLSWWQDVGELTDDESLLHADGAIQTLREMVMSKVIPDEVTIEGSDENSKELGDHFKAKKARFIQFLDKALELKQPILASI